MIEVSVPLLWGVRSLYATMPRRLFNALEDAHLAGRSVALIHASDLLEVFRPAAR